MAEAAGDVLTLPTSRGHAEARHMGSGRSWAKPLVHQVPLERRNVLQNGRAGGSAHDEAGRQAGSSGNQKAAAWEGRFRMADVTITVRKNGPHVVSGTVEVK